MASTAIEEMIEDFVVTLRAAVEAALLARVAATLDTAASASPGRVVPHRRRQGQYLAALRRLKPGVRRAMQKVAREQGVPAALRAIAARRASES
jgi:hypothetical protein